MNFLGIFYDGADPAAALIRNGKLIAYVEEERLVRLKHATDYFPYRSIQYCLEAGGIELSDVDYITYGWNCPKYSNGFMRKFYDGINKKYNVDEATLGWQQRLMSFFNAYNQKDRIHGHLRKIYGDVSFPEIRFVPHHFTHAFSAYHYSGFEDALTITIDGSGDENCTVIWEGRGGKLTQLKSFDIPQSLGWYYAAFTEYLGFRAYDGEYKVMGLAAYGKPQKELIEKVKKVLTPLPDGEYRVDPDYIFYGSHKFSERFTDKLADLFERPPRLPDEEIGEWHRDLSFAVQHFLEETVLGIVAHYTKKTGLRKVCIGGGVGLNIKMNERIYESGLVDDIFVQPICSDAGTSFASAAATDYALNGNKPETMTDVYLGPEYSNEEIETHLKRCKLDYRQVSNIDAEAAKILSSGGVVGWFQGRMEGGPRSLGARSILADPRTTESRDKVNAVVKYREYWRPFCPSILDSERDRLLNKPTEAPFMILGFEASDAARKEIPAVVHVDDTVRVQVVKSETNKRFATLLEEFKSLTGVGAVLNTSFNVKGEPIVCNPLDAIRTFSATGLDALAIGDFIVQKPKADIRG
jgi:carbamoyltransferase